MPELPEVETVRRALHARLAGRIISRASRGRKRLRSPWPINFTARLAGRRVTGLARRGKYVLIHLDSREQMLVHLGMSGRFTLAPSGAHARHVHLRFFLDDGTCLAYCDPRRFGQIDLLPPGAASKDPRLAKLGLEPFDAALTPAHLRHAWRNTKRAIKPLLLDQSPIAGIGNIYACEALFAAQISPFTPGAGLGQRELARLIEALRAMLRRAIAAGGASLRDHQSPEGLDGRFQFQFRVYDRAGRACSICGGLIRRHKTGKNGRATFFCPACQLS